jgi:hypothetical protein
MLKFVAGYIALGYHVLSGNILKCIVCLAITPRNCFYPSTPT